MMVITPCRDQISDRFPVLSFVVRVPASRWFEIACATDPRLFWPSQRAHRRADNFLTSGSRGLFRAAAGQATYMVPPDELRRFAGAPRLYYALATYRSPDGRDPMLTLDRPEGLPWIRIGGDFGRRSVGAPSPARYGGDPAPLTWGGDAAFARPLEDDEPTPAPLSGTCWVRPAL